MVTKISISELKVIGGTIVLFFSFKVISPFTVLLPLTHDFWKMVENNSLVNQYGNTLWYLSSRNYLRQQSVCPDTVLKHQREGNEVEFFTKFRITCFFEEMILVDC